jgi:UDP-3-O-[3-hydroxymyristoyl] N-acetylglucosamine deacetylase
MPQFQTLETPVEISDIGLHSGAKVLCRLLPRTEAGIEFVRTDLPGAPALLASSKLIAQTHHATVLQHGDTVISTPEHLLAALWALGVTNCRIELNGLEVPILDGSSEIWCEAVDRAGIAALDGERPKFVLQEPILVTAGEGAVLGLPHQTFRVTVDVDYAVPYLTLQSFAAELTAKYFREEIAAARTFARHDWIEPLRARGMIRGGSTDNALVLFENEPSSELRFPNELARHKALDLIGDVSLLVAETGGVLCAHLIAIRAGHELHRLWMQEAVRRQALHP